MNERKNEIDIEQLINVDTSSNDDEELIVIINLLIEAIKNNNVEAIEEYTQIGENLLKRIREDNYEG